MNIYHFTIFIGLFFAVTCNQSGEHNPTIEKVYLNKTDSTKNCYTLISPAKLPASAFLFLIPGFGETAEEVLQQTSLPIQLAQNGILTVIPTLQDGILSFGVDSLSQQALNLILNDVVAKHKLRDQKFYVGGFSIGGSCALKYAENPTIPPTAIFAIDPPIDFEAFYYSAKRNVRLSEAGQANPENIYMIDRLEKETGGSPATHRMQYYKLSPYSISDTTQTAVKKLTDIPIRIYTEPDVNWWLSERNADLTGMNATYCSAMINELNRLGNKNAVLITTQNKGYRKPDNRKHPHSWSIVDNEELVQWLLNQK